MDIANMSRRIPELDGLRGIAILVVLLFHAREEAWMFAPLSFLHTLLGLGVNGVDLFFVLSGFLITGILLDTKGTPGYFYRFYLKRALRIAPVYYLAVGAFFWIQLPWFHSHGQALNISAREQGWYWSFLMNWHDVSGHMVGGLAHFWSLGIEEQFYAFWPLVVFTCPKRYFATLFLGLCAFALAVRVAIATGGFVPGELVAEWIHRATITRLDALAIGALVALLVRNQAALQVARSWVKIAGPAAFSVFALCWMMDSRVPLLVQTLGYTAMALGCSCCVLICATDAGGSHVLCRITRSQMLQQLGKYSYAIYVLHVAANVFIRTRIKANMVAIQATHITPLMYSLAMLALCLAGGYCSGFVSWKLVEQHFLRLKSRVNSGLPLTTWGAKGEAAPAPSTIVTASPTFQNSDFR